MNPRKEIQKHYDDHAEEWMRQKDDPFYHIIQFWKFIEYIPPTARILDIGCAGGIHTKMFQLWPSLLHDGIDISRRMIDIAKAKYPRQRFWNCDLMNFVLTGEAYDAFWAAAVLMHFHPEEIQSAMQKIEGITKPRAIGYVTLPISRPDPNTVDKRHFSFYMTDEAFALFRLRNWRVREHGNLEYKGSPSVWMWYIVELP